MATAFGVGRSVGAERGGLRGRTSGSDSAEEEHIPGSGSESPELPASSGVLSFSSTPRSSAVSARGVRRARPRRRCSQATPLRMPRQASSVTSTSWPWSSVFGREGEEEEAVLALAGVNVALLEAPGARLSVAGDGAMLLCGDGGEAFLASHRPRLLLVVVLWVVFVPSVEFSWSCKTSAVDSVTSALVWGSASCRERAPSRAILFRSRRASTVVVAHGTCITCLLSTLLASSSAKPPSGSRPPDGPKEPGSAAGETCVFCQGTPPPPSSSHAVHLSGLWLPPHHQQTCLKGHGLVLHALLWHQA